MKGKLVRKLLDDPLIAASEGLEKLTSSKVFSGMSIEEKIDVGARLRSIAKMVNDLDADIKADIQAALKLKDGKLPDAATKAGLDFKANLTKIDGTRLDGKKVEVNHPRIYAECLVPQVQYRITYEPR